MAGAGKKGYQFLPTERLLTAGGGSAPVISTCMHMQRQSKNGELSGLCAREIIRESERAQRDYIPLVIKFALFNTGSQWK